MNNPFLSKHHLKIEWQSISYIVILIGLYLPVITIFAKLLMSNYTYTHALTFLGSNVFLNTLSFSLKEALLSAFLSILVGFPGAYFFGRFEFPGKKIFRSMLVIPFMMPGILLVLGLVVFYGNNGFFNYLIHQITGSQWKFTGLYGFWGIILAHVIYNFPLCIRLLGESWERINPALLEAAGTLGSKSFFTWWRITLPLLLPTIIYLFVLIFLYSFLSFTVVLVFGGFLYKTFEVLIYIEYNHKLHFEEATMIAGLQSLILSLVIFLQSFISKKLQNKPIIQNKLPKLTFKNAPWQSTIFLLYAILALFFLVSPLITIIGRSFIGNQVNSGFNLSNYVQIFGNAFQLTVGYSFWQVLLNSIILAMIVSITTVFLAYFIIRFRRDKKWGVGDLWLQLPLGISFMSFSFGLLNLFGINHYHLGLICWAQIFLAFPLVYSILRTARRDLNESMLENAALLGASPFPTFLKVELPLMRRALSSAIAYGMAISLGDLAAVMVIGKGEFITLSVAIYRLIGHYHFQMATALGSIFILFAIIIFFLMENDFFYSRSRP